MWIVSFLLYFIKASNVYTSVVKKFLKEIYFMFILYNFPNRRLEQNQITEIPTKAFAAYKKLKRMYVMSDIILFKCIRERER